MSEVIAFVLSFSMILISVGVLYTAGIGALMDLQASEQTRNAEQVFLAVGDSFGELQEGQAPKRAGSLDLDIGATVGVHNQSEMNVSVDNGDYQELFYTRSLTYSIDETQVAYENGGIFRKDHESSAMLGAPPELYCSNNSEVAVVSMVQLQSENQPSVAAGTVTIIGVKDSTQLLFPDARTGSAVEGTHTVSINVTSPYEDAWNQHFESNDTDWVPVAGEESVECRNVESVFIRETIIEVRIVA